mmetsp:Transcript_26657/g.30631  ORF Transcript_26657/g.30631 Transcript_26657/m.30631 type:complete len:83 (-) Transcript_26657:1073-1321(-)
MNSGAGGANRNYSEYEEAQDSLEVIYEISQILNTGLDRKTLSILVSLCECGVNPEALATVVKELKRESQILKSVSLNPEGRS